MDLLLKFEAKVKAPPQGGLGRTHEVNHEVCSRSMICEG
jgi:hypothetical protein